MPAPFRLLLITDPSIPRWLDAALAAIDAAPRGTLAIQVRAEGAGAAELLHLAENLVVLCAPRAVPVIVNDRVDVAVAARASGVHLKEHGLEVAAARRVLALDPSAGALVGASCHDTAGIARRRDADYVVLGPLAAVPGKGEPLGLARFAALARGAGTAIVALGGIDASLAGDAIRAGASAVAVSRAILTAPDPAAATRALLDAIARAQVPAS